jgi:hypothetical protein
MAPDFMAVGPPATEELNITEASPEALSMGYASWHIAYADSTLVDIRKRKSSSFATAMGSLMFVPTLLIKMSSLPVRREAVIHFGKLPFTSALVVA